MIPLVPFWLSKLKIVPVTSIDLFRWDKLSITLLQRLFTKKFFWGRGVKDWERNFQSKFAVTWLFSENEVNKFFRWIPNVTNFLQSTCGNTDYWIEEKNFKNFEAAWLMFERSLYILAHMEEFKYNYKLRVILYLRILSRDEIR